MEWMANKLKQLRELSGFNQKQVADFLGVDQSFISKIEKNVRKLDVGQLEKLLSLYGCDLVTFNNKGTNIEPIKIAFRADKLDTSDLNDIANIRKIANNSMIMEKIIDNGIK